MLLISAVRLNAITIEIETLKKSSQPLFQINSNEIYKWLILQENYEKYGEYITDTIPPLNIIAQSKTPDSLVSYGYHSFLNGMYQAYSDHRPFELSPDMIWLLISQGFAHHVNNNAEKLRHYFVDFEGKTTLVVRDDRILLDDPNSPWEDVFPEFSKQISKHTGNELIEALTCSFSTTTPTTKVASEITIMHALKQYFEFMELAAACGIPTVKLDGTPEDWKLIIDKANYLRKYELDWWLDELEPVLKQIYESSKGNIDRKFWRNMFRVHSEDDYGDIVAIDGWIAKFYPYDKDGNRLDLKIIASGNNLPDEIVKVDLEYYYVNGKATEHTPLELWAGFDGLEQNSKDYTLTPHIGWMIKKRDDATKRLKESFAKMNVDPYGENDNFIDGINITVKTIPEELLSLGHIYKLIIHFKDKIILPDEFYNLQVDELWLEGKIDDDEKAKIIKNLPNTSLRINYEDYNKANKK
jgi:hypothetical protein